MAEAKLYDSNQLELVGGEIVEAEDRPKRYLSEKQMEQRRLASKAAVMARLNNTERIQQMAICAEIGKKSDYNDPEKMLECFGEYLTTAEEYGWRVGNMTAYLAMGVTKSQIEEWYNGGARASDPRYKQLATYVKTVCAAYREQLGLEGAIHPALTIFWQRNYDGLTNEDIVRVEQANPLGERLDAKEIAEKYKDIPDD